ncbi:transposase IS4 family protein [Streptomyces sp. 769]|nr:transposase IS4 family protein [Streptomyces sp. 769]
MLDQSTANTGIHPKHVLVDAGYCSETNLEAARDRQLDCDTSTFMATGRLPTAAARPSSNPYSAKS